MTDGNRSVGQPSAAAGNHQPETIPYREYRISNREFRMMKFSFTSIFDILRFSIFKFLASVFCRLTSVL
jgi:hypothetical protein